jgi:hypothetical protein
LDGISRRYKREKIGKTIENRFNQHAVCYVMGDFSQKNFDFSK